MSQIITKGITDLAVTNAKIANATIVLTTKVTGILPVANGGTNSSTALSNNRVIQSSGGAIVEAAAITAARALISDANGIPTQSTVTSATLAFLDATSSVQTQLNGKANTALSNLTTTSINQNLLPDTDLNRNLGSTTNRFNVLYSAFLKDAADNVVLDIEGHVLNDTNEDPAIDFSDPARVTISHPLHAANTIVDASDVLSIDSDSRNLVDSNGASIAIDYSDPLKVTLGTTDTGTTARIFALTDGVNGNVVNLRAPNTLAASTHFVLPPTDGTSGQFLQTNGSGVTTWVTPGSAAINKKETYTLSGTDITNQYVDLTHVASTDSINFTVQGLPPTIQAYTGSTTQHDYTVNYTGGAGGNTRITFANGLATGGASALVAGDIVQVQYEY